MKTTVNYVSVSQPLAELVQAANKLSSVISDVQSIYSNVSYYTGLGLNTKANLKKAITDIGNYCSDINQLYKAGNQAMIEYCICENRLAGNDVSEFFSKLTVDTEATRCTTNYNWENLRKMVAEIGFAGSVTGSIWGLTEGGSTAWKSGVKLVETGAKTVQKMADGKLVDLYGTFADKGNTFSDELGKYVYDPSKCTTVTAKNASKIGVAAKWVGVAFSGMLNFVDNLEEYDSDLSNPRVYAETVGETVADIGLGVAIGAGITALAGVAAPVWAVGVISTVAVGIADDLVEIYTDKDSLAELVSDTALKIAETANEVVKKTSKFVGKAVRATADRISVGWKNFKSWF